MAEASYWPLSVDVLLKHAFWLLNGDFRMSPLSDNLNQQKTSDED
jgi:hypothetical protein